MIYIAYGHRFFLGRFSLVNLFLIKANKVQQNSELFVGVKI